MRVRCQAVDSEAAVAPPLLARPADKQNEKVTKQRKKVYMIPIWICTSATRKGNYADSDFQVEIKVNIKSENDAMLKMCVTE